MNLDRLFGSPKWKVDARTVMKELISEIFLQVAAPLVRLIRTHIHW